MKLKDLAALLLAAASFLTAVAGAWKTLHEVKSVDDRLYAQAADGIGDNADELYRLKQRIAALEAAGGRR